MNLTGEPSLAVAPDGAVYVAAPSNNGTDGAANLAWRGEPGGWEWAALGEIAAEHGSNDADVAVAPDGSVWEATFWSRPSSTCVTVSVSRDRGEGWAGADACGDPMPGSREFVTDRPWLATTASRTYLLYSLSQAGLPEATALSSSTDGRTWSAHTLPFPPGLLVGRLVTDGSILAVPLAPILPGNAAAGEVVQGAGPVLATSDDGGETWSYVAVAHEATEGRLTADIAADGAIAAWAAPGPATGQLVHVALAGADLSFGDPIEVEASGSNAYVWTAARPGHRLASWLHTDEPGGPGNVPAGAAWHVRLWLDGVVHDWPQVVAMGPLCPTSTVCKTADSRDLGDFFSSALLPDGTPVVAVNDATADGAEPFASPTLVLWGTPP